ncbi:MAG: hypothetical protein HY906_18990 [Deltaproteobacteria bacterium]|nr:hypothetical protein [Deltaproteobacteria bacterium]
MRWPALAGLTLLVLLAVGGCGGDPDDAHRDGGIDEVPCTPGQPFDLTGTFGVLTTLHENVEVLGLQLEDPNPQAEIILRVELEQTGHDVAMQSLMCSVDLPPIQLAGQPKPILFKLPADLLEALDQVPGSATVSGDTTCSTYDTTIPVIVILGYRPADPIADPVPQDPDTQGCDGDSTVLCSESSATGCICDQEADGFPGASLLMENAPVFDDLDFVYATLRVVVHLQGVVHSSDLYRGEVNHTLEQYILGCHRTSGPCSEQATEVIRNVNPTIRQDPASPSTFISKRIDPSWDCERLLLERPNLFPK